MSSHYFTYVTKDGNYQRLKVILAEAFATEFVDRESGWWGEYALSNDGNEIKLYPNFVSGAGYHQVEKSEFPYLLEIPDRNDPKYIIELMLKLPIAFELIEHCEV